MRYKNKFHFFYCVSLFMWRKGWNKFVMMLRVSRTCKHKISFIIQLQMITCDSIVIFFKYMYTDLQEILRPHNIFYLYFLDINSIMNIKFEWADYWRWLIEFELRIKGDGVIFNFTLEALVFTHFLYVLLYISTLILSPPSFQIRKENKHFFSYL